MFRTYEYSKVEAYTNVSRIRKLPEFIRMAGYSADRHWKGGGGSVGDDSESVEL
jgi:hypothetical protein